MRAWILVLLLTACASEPALAPKSDPPLPSPQACIKPDVVVGAIEELKARASQAIEDANDERDKALHDAYECREARTT